MSVTPNKSFGIFVVLVCLLEAVYLLSACKTSPDGPLRPFTAQDCAQLCKPLEVAVYVPGYYGDIDGVSSYRYGSVRSRVGSVCKCYNSVMVKP